VLYHALGEHRRALEYYEQALTIHREVGNRVVEATTLNNIGMVYRALGDNRRALEYFEQALPIHREVGNRAVEATTLFNIATIRQAEGNYAEAVRLLEQVVAIDEAIESPNLEGDRARWKRRGGSWAGSRSRPPPPALPPFHGGELESVSVIPRISYRRERYT